MLLNDGGTLFKTSVSCNNRIGRWDVETYAYVRIHRMAETSPEKSRDRLNVDRYVILYNSVYRNGGWSGLTWFMVVSLLNTALIFAICRRRRCFGLQNVCGLHSEVVAALNRFMLVPVNSTNIHFNTQRELSFLGAFGLLSKSY